MNLKKFYFLLLIKRALHDGLDIMKNMAVAIDPKNDEEVKKTLRCCVGTKFAARWSDLIVNLALKSVRTIMKGASNNKLNVDIKRYAKVEKVRKKKNKNNLNIFLS